MLTAEAGFRLSALEEGDLAQDPYPDLPVQLDVHGGSALRVAFLGGRGGLRLRLDSASLADLVAQGRSLQLTLARRARRQAEAELVAEGTQVGIGVADSLRNDVGLLQRVAAGLRRLPDIPPAKESSPDEGGP